MCFRIIGHLGAHPGLEHESATIFQFSVQLAFKTKQNVTFYAPVVCEVPGCVDNLPDTDVTEQSCFPVSNACLATMLCLVNFRPVSRPKWNTVHFHDCIFRSVSCRTDGHWYRRECLPVEALLYSSRKTRFSRRPLLLPGPAILASVNGLLRSLFFLFLSLLRGCSHMCRDRIHQRRRQAIVRLKADGPQALPYTTHFLRIKSGFND